MAESLVSVVAGLYTSQSSDGNKVLLEVHCDLTDDGDYWMEFNKEDSFDHDSTNVVKQSDGLTKQIIEFQSRKDVVPTNDGGKAIKYDSKNIAKQRSALTERIRQFQNRLDVIEGDDDEEEDKFANDTFTGNGNEDNKGTLWVKKKRTQ